MKSEQVLEKSFKWFLDNIADLVKKYPERFIAIKNCKVLGSYDSFDEALEKTQKSGHPFGTFIVQKASADASAYTATYYNDFASLGAVR